MSRLLLLTFLTACSTPGATGDTVDTAAGECVSGDTWTGGNEESPLMNPGEACIACHDSEGEGPDYTVAGTVYSALDEPDDCNGVTTAVVRVTDADGTVFDTTTNGAGNFFFEDAIVMPYTAEVEFSDGTIAAMSGEQSDGECNACHTPGGDGGAPGRIAQDAAQ